MRTVGTEVARFRFAFEIDFFEVREIAKTEISVTITAIIIIKTVKDFLFIFILETPPFYSVESFNIVPNSSPKRYSVSKRVSIRVFA